MSRIIRDRLLMFIGKSSNVPAIYVEAITKLKMQDTTGRAEKLGYPPSFSSREEGEEWIRNKLSDSDYTDSLITRYKNIIDTSLVNSIDEMKDYAYSVKSDLDKAGLKLVPQPYPGFFKYSFDKHFLGVLIMVGFLSLGAPFWFNALKTLSALRPILATKEDEEQKKLEDK